MRRRSGALQREAPWSAPLAHPPGPGCRLPFRRQLFYGQLRHVGLEGVDDRLNIQVLRGERAVRRLEMGEHGGVGFEHQHLVRGGQGEVHAAVVEVEALRDAMLAKAKASGFFDALKEAA